MLLPVSVALCTYNGARFLHEQLASIAAQSRLPGELVVVDDASSDASRDIVTAFATTAPFPVRSFFQGTNRGSTASFEVAIAACALPLVALCDQDDVWRVHKLERLAAALEEQPHAGYAFSDAELVDEALRPLGARMWDTVGFASGGWREFAGARQIDLLLERTRVTGATMMVRADCVSFCRPFPNGVVHDRWLAMVLSAIGRYGIALDDALVEYRQHANQQIGATPGRGRPSLRAQLGRDFVLARRRRMRRELALDEAFAEQLDRLIVSGALDENGVANARRAAERVLERSRHVATRVSLDGASFGGTIGAIVGEVVNGGYRRFSGGWGATWADALYSARYRRGDRDAIARNASL
jgi:glycosyltransferase involved in cell wall biosynthesis